jgi:hypothetical protein
VNLPRPDIHDIRAPYLIPQDWRVPALIATAAVLVLALCWWGWRRIRARHPPLTLLQRTLQQLEATRALMEAGDARTFSAAVSDVVRGYIEARFEVMATHRTTAEFLNDCVTQEGSALQAHAQTLAQFLRFCDLAKFARWSFDGQQLQGMLASARHFVETTAAPVPAQAVLAPQAANVPIRQS